MKNQAIARRHHLESAVIKGAMTMLKFIRVMDAIAIAMAHQAPPKIPVDVRAQSRDFPLQRVSSHRPHWARH